jgi:hypothetical protein
MTGFNHALVGGLLAKLLPLPLALPLAFISHYVLDALPHYGIPNVNKENYRPWRIVFIVDTILTVTLLNIYLYFGRIDMLVSALISMSPDIVWLQRMVWNRTLDFLSDANWFTRLHNRIQQFERPWGLYVEVPLAAALITILVG